MRHFRWALLGMMAIAAASGADAPPATKPAQELSPTRVTLQFKDRSPLQAFAELGRAANIEFVGSDPAFWAQASAANPTGISLDVQNQTYWHVMAELCAAAGLCPVRAEKGKVTLARDING